MKLAYAMWDIAKEEHASDNHLHQKHGCEKAYLVATKASDVLLLSKNESVPIGEAIAHTMREDIVNTWSKMGPQIQHRDQQYSLYKDKLHEPCLYKVSNPKEYQELFESVQGFLDKIAEMLKNTRMQK